MKSPEEILDNIPEIDESSGIVGKYSDEAIKAAMVAYASQDDWISVKDKMPEDKPTIFSEVVLLHVVHIPYENNKYYIVTGYYNHMKCRWEELNGEWSAKKSTKVTHWKKLPKPPQIENVCEF